MRVLTFLSHLSYEIFQKKKNVLWEVRNHWIFIRLFQFVLGNITYVFGVVVWDTNGRNVNGPMSNLASASMLFREHAAPMELVNMTTEFVDTTNQTASVTEPNNKAVRQASHFFLFFPIFSANYYFSYFWQEMPIFCTFGHPKRSIVGSLTLLGMTFGL